MRSFACAAARTFSSRIGRSRSIASENVPLGLAMKSTAPSAMASNVASAPSAVSAEIITTGRGASSMIRLRQVNPSMPGISTSSVMTCGSKLCSNASASMPSRATRTSKSPAATNTPSSSFRINAEVIDDQETDHEAVGIGRGSACASAATALASPSVNSCAGSMSRIIRASRFTTRPISRICSFDSSGAG